MLSPKRIRELMELAIEESEKSVSEDDRIHPKVGAVIANEQGRIVAKAHRGEEGHGDHAERIAFSKAEAADFTDFSTATLFTTLEPCTRRGADKKPCSERIVMAGIQNVYIGALDPNPDIVGHGEIYLREKIGNVERFPSDLERRIRTISRNFWALYYKSHLPSSSMYMALRVSEMILKKLKTANIDIDYLPSEHEYTLRDLSAYICGRGLVHRERAELMPFLLEARAHAFDEKYSAYTYEEDARRIEERWKKEFPGIIMKRFRIYDWQKRTLLNVGIGNGFEGVGLFDQCVNFTGVDIATESIKIAQSRLPKARLCLNAAEDMTDIPDSTQDIYVSLRTYQSSFFDIQEAVREAYRVLLPGGVFLASIANAYMEGNSLIKGLMPHNSKFVDLDRAHDLINLVRHSLTKLRFEEVGVHSGRAEEYVFGKKRFA